MPVTSQKVVKKRPKNMALSKQEALDFAQLILDIYKDKKQSQYKGQDKTMQFIKQIQSLIAAGVSDGPELRALSQRPLLLFGKVKYEQGNSSNCSLQSILY